MNTTSPDTITADDAAGNDALVDVAREYTYLPSHGENLFTCLHSFGPPPARDTAVVICNPLGVEYMSGHRSIRTLADTLAARGIPTLRFDYAFTGDSSGEGFANASVHTMVRDAIVLIDHALARTAASKVAVLGIGLGAVVAALAARERAGANLVMWNPPPNGRRFVREQKLLSELLNKELGTPGDEIDAAGICLSREMQDEISKIDLTKLDLSRVGQVLYVSRSDMEPPTAIVEKMIEAGTQVSHVALPGYREMMDHPTDTIIPSAAIDSICNWLLDNSAPASSAAASAARRGETTLCIPGESETSLSEHPVHFGPDDRLFGIVCEKTPSQRGRPALVFLNCGSEQHVGPHRLYTRLARLMASRGFITLRFDIEGIGESQSRGDNPDNNSYSPVALRDIRAAFAYLTEAHGCEKFTVTGICAGAFHSFRTAVEIEEYAVQEAVLINPLVFEWDYDDPDNHYEHKAHTYKGAMSDPKRWRKLFTGQADYGRLARATVDVVLRKSESALGTIASALSKRLPEGLAGDLERARRQGRPLTLLLAESDPGYDILRLFAPRQTSAGMRDGMLNLHWIENANHGFSKKVMQDRLITRFLALDLIT